MCAPDAKANTSDAKIVTKLGKFRLTFGACVSVLALSCCRVSVGVVRVLRLSRILASDLDSYVEFV